MKFIQILADLILSVLRDPEILDRCRAREGAFTRNRGKLPYWNVIKLLLMDSKNTYSATLDQFFSNLAKSAGSPFATPVQCTEQAFSKARAGLKPDLFCLCFEKVRDFLCARDSHAFDKRLLGEWGLQIIAIDGSKIPLPNRKELLRKYGSTGRGSSSPTAIASIAYDVLNARIIDAEFDSMSVDERTLAVRHMSAMKDKQLTDLLYTIFVFDRGYASEKLISFIEDSIGACYLFRLRTKFSVEIDALPVPLGGEVGEHIITLNGRKTRVIRFRLSSGVIETLLTNEFSTPRELFRQIYFLRWPIEENYKLIKEKVGLTDFRGYSENSVLQEFWISVLLANLSLAVKKETDGIIDAEYNHKGSKHRYQTNMNELSGCICRRIGDYLDASTIHAKLSVIRDIFDFAVHHRVVDKKGTGESYPRQAPRKCKHHYNNKKTH